jgi:hypothetical protein
MCNILHVTTRHFIFRICPCCFSFHFTSWLSDVRHFLSLSEPTKITRKWQRSKIQINNIRTIKTLTSYNQQQWIFQTKKSDIYIYNSNKTGNVRISQLRGASPNNCCRTKVIIFKYYECVSVVFIFIRLPSDWLLSHVSPHHPTHGMIFGKNYRTKNVFWFPLQLLY